MKKMLTRPALHVAVVATAIGGLLAWSGQHNRLEASSHREAPLIADDPLADNTDVYAFKDPSDPEMINIIANFIPFQLPQGGPNYYHFGENIRYEIHIKNDPSRPGDDLTFRFTFTRQNQDPSTFFNIRLGQENLKTTYKLEQSQKGGAFITLMDRVPVPAYNVGARSISGAAGLNAPSYDALMSGATIPAGGGKAFCGPVDDPFFVDIGGIFDLGGVRPQSARDGLYHKNVSTIALQLPIYKLQKIGKNGSQAANILDPDYVIGVWASASRPALRTLMAPDAKGNTTGAQTMSGDYVQVSRLGMPLTNEVINPIGNKDEFNARTPYSENAAFRDNFSNPELGLYMADNMPKNGAAPKPAGQTYFGEAVPGFGPLRIQSKSLAGRPGLPANGFDFRNGANGLAVLKGNAALNGTALADAAFGNLLLQAGKPRSVDLLPIFLTGVPNLRPYQLATGKGGNPLAVGKPFVNNFLPVVGDMLRLNMAVPATPRNSPDFSSEGLLAAAKLGLVDARYNGNTSMQVIPNMDGFPNGRRLEDDVTRIELQAVGGVVLAAIGLWYDDFGPADMNPVTPQLGSVLGFTTGIERNDTTFKAAFPYVQAPWAGPKAQITDVSKYQMTPAVVAAPATTLAIQPVLTNMQVYPNPMNEQTTFQVNTGVDTNLTIVVSNSQGQRVATLANGKAFSKGTHEISWHPDRSLPAGRYIVTVYSGSTKLQSIQVQRD